MPYGYWEKTRSEVLSQMKSEIREKIEKFERKTKMVLSPYQIQQIEKHFENEIKMRELLENEPVSGMQRIPYYNFGRHILKASKSQGCLALKRVIEVERDRWIALGSNKQILDKITKVVLPNL